MTRNLSRPAQTTARQPRPVSLAAGDTPRHGVAVARSSFLFVVDLTDRRVEIDHQPVIARASAEGPGTGQRPSAYRVELADMTERERPQAMPIVEGAITVNGNTDWVAPARRMSTWSMWVAPAIIAATNVKILRPGRNEPVLTC